MGSGRTSPQFSLLVLVNAFVGGMVGLERTVVPLIGTQEFGIGSEVVVFSFIITFGLIKACVNLVSGLLADRYTRKTVLVAGWVVGLPVPFMLAYGPSWAWIVGANVLLGISQGLAWSMTVNMKIDLVGPGRRGFAMGLNEAAGYGALGLTALATGYVAARYGLRPEPFYVGIVYSALGLVLSVFLVRDTRGHARLEASAHNASEPITKPSTAHVFAETSWRNKTLFSASQAGLVNNLNDGMSWGVFPLLFVAQRCELGRRRTDQGRLPGYLGCRSDRHRILGRSHRAEAADCVGHARSGRWPRASSGWAWLPRCYPVSSAQCCWVLARRWCIPPCSRPSAMSLTRHGEPRRWVSIDSGAILGTRWAR